MFCSSIPENYLIVGCINCYLGTEIQIAIFFFFSTSLISQGKFSVNILLDYIYPKFYLQNKNTCNEITSKLIHHIYTKISGGM